jgi:hypothetical protein
MFTHPTRTPTTLPIPIAQTSKVRRNVVNTSCTPPKSSSVTSNAKSFEYYYQERHGSVSTSSTPTKATMFSMDDDEDKDVCVVSCTDITRYLTSSRVHLVNGLNVDKSMMGGDIYFVLCDCPKIKTPDNYLTYSLLETKKGVLAFTAKEYAKVMKEQLSLDYHIVKVTKDELASYTEALKTNAIVLYNSYTDMDVKTSYFLYFLL